MSKKTGVLVEYFSVLAEHSSGGSKVEFEDSLLWARGMEEICSEILEDLTEASDSIFEMKQTINP